jgi:SAM-dependent methyltransferase
VDLREIRSEVLQRHPWEKARARFFLQRLEQAGLLARPLQVIDVGAGDGWFAGELLRRLPSGSRVVCVDSNYTDEHLAKLPAAFGSTGPSFARELPAGSFDLVMLLDVIEHVGDDLGFLRGLVERQLRPGGHVLVSVPAWMSLFTRHDLGVAHHRRYRPAQLAEVITSAGLGIAASGGLFHSLLFPRALQKLGETARGIRSVPAPETPLANAGEDIATWRRGKVITGAIDFALAADNGLSAVCARLGVPLPGLSAWALAHRA